MENVLKMTKMTKKIKKTINKKEHAKEDSKLQEDVFVEKEKRK